MKNRKVIISLVGVLIMLLLIISATYAYFSVTVSGNGSKTMITANTPKKHSLSVSTLYDDIHIHVDNEDMKLANVGSYYGAVDKDNRYETDLTTGTHQIIEVSSKGMENIRYSCSGDIKVTLNIDNDSMGSVLEREDVLLYLKGLGLDETLDLSTLKINNTKIYNTSFEIDGDSSDYLSAIVELINKESYQNYIANKMLNVSIEAENMVCHENGTYKYLVKLNKSVKEIQNGNEIGKWVSLFYDEEGIYQKIQNIYLVDYINTSKAIKTWELGDTDRGTKLDEVMGWLETTPDTEDSYDLYIGADGPMRAAKNMSRAFQDFTNLKKISGNALDTSEVTNMAYIFYQNTNLTDISALANWDISNVNDLTGLFYRNSNLLDITPLKDWNLSNVNSLSGMFKECSNLIDITPLTNWNVSHITNMNEIFYYTKLSDLTPLANWNLSKVIYINSMFESTLISDLTPISKWNVSKVITMNSLFKSCKNLVDLTPLSNWNVSNVTEMSSVFQYTSLYNLMPLSNWDVSHATNMNSMFNNTKINDLTPLKDWDISNVTSMNSMFSYTQISNLNGIESWNIEKLANMGGIFSYSNLNNIEAISNWDISHVTSIGSIFYHTSLSDISPIKNWNISSVKDMGGMIGRTAVNDLTPIKDWDVSKVESIATLFYNTYVSDLTPIENWDVSNITNMASLFGGSSVTDLAPIAHWDVSNVTNMDSMFAGTKITDLSPIANWDVSNVIYIGGRNASGSGLFQNCTNLEKIDLSNWKMPKLIGVSKIFAGCTNLKEVYLPQAPFNTISDETYFDAFFGGKTYFDANYITVPNNIKVYTESSQVDWVKARLQEALGENNNSTVLPYE